MARTFCRFPLLPALAVIAASTASALLASASAAGAADFAEITAEERALTSVPGAPNAPAVVLFRKAVFMPDRVGGSGSSTFTVQVRRKILTAEGKKFGEVLLHHSRYARLYHLKGRTVLPDGKVMPLPDDAVFRRRTSESDKRFVTSVAFPAVTVGAILDYRFELKVDTLYNLEPWYFQEEVPTLFSEIVYEVPKVVVVSGWMRDPMQTGIQQEMTKVITGSRIRFWGQNLPAVPDEPRSLPFADMASRAMLVPTSIANPYAVVEIFKDWPSTCELYGDSYEKARRKSGKAQDRARQLAAAVTGGGTRAQAEALYRFVRDEIATDGDAGVYLPDGTTADAVLADKRGGATAKAMLLLAMLQAIKVDGRPVWVAERGGGTPDLQLANPWWFDRAIVAVELDGQRAFLDPSDRSLAFGHLPPDLEGTPAVLYDRKKPEPVRLPEAPFADNVRHAEVKLALDAKGRLAGTGRLHLGGHHAWYRLHWQDDAEKTAKAWKDWLAAGFKDFEVADVKVDEAVDEQRLDVSWSLAQRAEEALGDEASLAPSRPLGPVVQAFQQPAAQRLSPVLLTFADSDQVQLTLTWPEGWKPESLPKPLGQANEVGAASASVDVDATARTLTYRRRFDLKQRLYGSHAQYEALQNLYTQMEKSDAQPLVLVRR
jgi:transglutaminase-like putative cysteine protease